MLGGGGVIRNVYNKALCPYVLVGRTAGPNWLNYVEGTLRLPGVNTGLKKRFLTQNSKRNLKNASIFLEIPRTTPCTPASAEYIKNNSIMNPFIVNKR